MFSASNITGGHHSTTPQSPFGHQHSFFMATSPISPTTPTSPYFYQRQRQSPPPVQYSPPTIFGKSRYSTGKHDECEPMSTSPIIHPQQVPREYLPAYLTGEAYPKTPEKRRHTIGFSDPMIKSVCADVDFEHGGSIVGGMVQDGSQSPMKAGPPTSGLGRNENCSPFFPMVTSSAKDSLNTSLGFVPSLLTPIPPTPPQPPTTSCWVTVFGFPAASTSTVLAHFAHCGTILDSKTVPGSNWVHLQYSNVIEARRALQRNGTLIGGSMMVGVSPTTENVVKAKGVGSDFFENLSPLSTSTTATSTTTTTVTTGTGNKENVDPQQPVAGPSRFSVSNQDQLRSRMRPMGRDAMDIQLPQQRSGFVSWTLDKIFGW